MDDLVHEDDQLADMLLHETGEPGADESPLLQEGLRRNRGRQNTIGGQVDNHCGTEGAGEQGIGGWLDRSVIVAEDAAVA